VSVGGNPRAANGHYEPYADDEEYDWVAVERVITGREEVGRRLTRSEKREVARRLLAKGWNRNQIARQMRISAETLRTLIEEEARR
jgi:DNA-binding NarL/FixJ family response regulator